MKASPPTTSPWSKHLAGRDVGLVSVQWWIGNDNEPHSYYTPEQVYREIDLALQKLHVTPGTLMFQGFSRGAANSYTMAALDAGRGKKYFALNVASSGGVALDYGPLPAANSFRRFPNGSSLLPHTGADRIAVAEDVVHAGDGRPNPMRNVDCRRQNERALGRIARTARAHLP